MVVGSWQLAVGSWQWAVGSGQVVAGSGLRALGGQVAALPYTWRWRPRHRICQPTSRNQSIPAQRTTTGASSPRQILKCQNGQMQTQSQIENHESQIPTANYPLSATTCQLPTTNYQLKKAKGDAPRASPPDTGGASATHTLVEVAGFEPATSCLQSRRSTS